MAPKKDVTSCEKLRGAANERRAVDIRMRELNTSNVVLHRNEQIVTSEGTWGTETSNYPEEKKEKSIPKVVASEIGRARTMSRNTYGVAICYTKGQKNIPRKVGRRG